MPFTWPGGPRNGPEEPTPRAGALLAALVASLVTAALAAPVLLAPGTRLFGRALVGRHHDPFTVIEQLRRGGFSFPYFQPVTDGAGWLIARIVGPVAALNTLTLAGFPLAAATAYLLARRATTSHGGALVASLLYAFSPFHVAHAAYHPHIAQTQWLPLYALALWRALENATASRLALLAATSLLLGLSNLYSGLIAGVLTVPVLGAAAVAAGQDSRRLRSWWRTTLMLACLGTIAVGGIIASTPEGLVAHRFPDSDAALFSARGRSYLLPPASHPVFGEWSRRIWQREGLSESLVEQQVGLGWSVLALAAFSVARRVRARDPGLPAVPWVIGIGALAFLASIPSGASWLHALAPTFRAYARFGAVVQLAAALLAGAGTAVLLRGSAPGRRLVAPLLLAAAAFEYAPLPPWPWRDVLPTRGHRWLAERPDRVVVLDCVPRSVAEHSLPDLFGRPLAFAEAPLDDCAEPELGAKLAGRGFTHVVVRRGTAVGLWLEARGPRPGLSVSAVFEDGVVLAVAPRAPAPLVVDLSGFHAREYDGGRTWRWMAREARWTIHSLASGPREASLEAELFAFPSRRRLDVVFDGAKVAELQVDSEARRFTIGPMAVPAGRSVLEFRPQDPPVVADSVLGNGDLREVSIALGDWRWRDATEALGH